MRAIYRLLAVAGTLLVAVGLSMGHTLAGVPSSHNPGNPGQGLMPAQQMPTLTLGSARHQAAAPEAAGPAAPLKDIRLPRVSTQGGTLRGPGYECTVLDQAVANPGQFGQSTDHAIMGVNFYCNTSGTTDLVYISTLEVVCVKPDVYRTSMLESHDFISENFHCFRTANWRPPYDAHQYNGAGLPELTQADVAATRSENDTIIGDGYECVPAEFTFLGYGDTVFNGDPLPLVGPDFACAGDPAEKMFLVEQYSTLCVGRNTFDMSAFEPLYVNSGKQYYCYVVRAEDLPPGDPTTKTQTATATTPAVAGPPAAAATPGTEPLPSSFTEFVRTGANLWFLIFGGLLLLVLGLVLYTLRARSSADPTPATTSRTSQASVPAPGTGQPPAGRGARSTPVKPTRKAQTTPSGKQPSRSQITPAGAGQPRPAGVPPRPTAPATGKPNPTPHNRDTTPAPKPPAATKPQPTRQPKPTTGSKPPPSRP